jgi:hypothetical protein
MANCHHAHLAKWQLAYGAAVKAAAAANQPVALHQLNQWQRQ